MSKRVQAVQDLRFWNKIAFFHSMQCVHTSILASTHSKASEDALATNALEKRSKIKNKSDK